MVAFDFHRQVAFVKFIGTHAEYDRVDALFGYASGCDRSPLNDMTGVGYLIYQGYRINQPR